MEQTKQTNITNTTWLDEEAQKIGTNSNFEKREAMKFEENKIAVVEIDFSKAFEKWNTTNRKGVEITKAIIPVLYDGKQKVWWLNLKNPTYKDIIHKGKAGQTLFKVLQTGKQESTKYVLVE